MIDICQSWLWITDSQFPAKNGRIWAVSGKDELATHPKFWSSPIIQSSVEKKWSGVKVSKFQYNNKIYYVCVNINIARKMIEIKRSHRIEHFWIRCRNFHFSQIKRTKLSYRNSILLALDTIYKGKLLLSGTTSQTSAERGNYTQQLSCQNKCGTKM